MKSLLLALCLSAVYVAPLRAGFVPESEAKTAGVFDLETDKLYQAVTGAHWNYIWHNFAVEIIFGRDGAMTKAPWGRTTWRITGPRTITFTSAKSKTGDMVAHFNPELTRWTCIDWSGGHASAVRLKSEPPEAR